MSNINYSASFGCYTIYFALPKELINKISAGGNKILPETIISVEATGITDTASNNYIIQYSTEFFVINNVSVTGIYKTIVDSPDGGSS